MRTLLTTITLTAALLLHAQAQSYLTNGLTAYYPFNGNANDASGNGNNGVVNGATLTTDRFSAPDSAYRFDGSSWIQLTDAVLPFAPSELTISAWVLADAGPYTTLEVIVQLTSRSAECYMGIGNTGAGSWNFGVKLQNEQGYSSGGPMISNVWAQWVGIYKQGQIQFWANGLLVQSNAIPDIGLYTNSVFPLNSAIGIYDYAPGPYLGFNGAIDDVRIYNRALSASEVRQLYQYELPPSIALKKAVKPTFSNLFIGTKYILQASSDLNIWYDQGPPFTATSTEMDYPDYYDEVFWNPLYFRLRVSP
jgi:hypothetical protein